jgi:hypothetical protein
MHLKAGHEPTRSISPLASTVRPNMAKSKRSQAVEDTSSVGATPAPARSSLGTTNAIGSDLGAVDAAGSDSKHDKTSSTRRRRGGGRSTREGNTSPDLILGGKHKKNVVHEANYVSLALATAIHHIEAADEAGVSGHPESPTLVT